MNICFITAGPIEWASSRLRAYWVAEALRERGHEVSTLTISEIRHENQLPSQVDVYIWQKTVHLEMAQEYAALGYKNYWDVCDPSWWWQPNECREIASHMEGVVASSQPLADDFNDWYGEDLAICIPDRLKLAHYHTQREHTAVSPVRFIWFGIAANRIALWSVKANLERLVANGHKIELTILDDRPDVPFKFSEAFPIYHTQWELSTEVDVLSSHDVALLPPYPGAWGKVKSNNKYLTAWACGLPVLSGREYDSMDYLMDSPQSRENIANKFINMGQLATIEQSAAEWEQLLS